MKRVLFIALITIALAGTILAYKRYASKPGIQVIETSVVKTTAIKESLVETGIIKPQVGAVVKIGARATGTISAMKVKIGDSVKKGELIAVIDQREAREAISQTEKAIETIKNRIEQIELTYPARIKEAGHNIEEMEAAFWLTSLERARKEELFGRGYISLQEKDNADAMNDEALARLKMAKSTLERLKDEYATELSIQKSELERTGSILKEQHIRLSYTYIYSPIDGTVSQVTAQEGETVVAGLQVANLVTVIDPEMLEMWIYVDETDIGRVRRGQKVEYYVDAYPEKTFHGTIEKIYPEPEIRDNIVYYLTIVTVNREYTELLRPQMTTHVRIIVNEKEDVLTVPNSALRYEKGSQVVYIVKPDGGVELRRITTGLTGESTTEVTSGLKDGDTVATKLIIPLSNKTNNKKGW